MVPIGGGSTKFVLSDRWIVYTKSRKNCYTENTFYMKQAVVYVGYLATGPSSGFPWPLFLPFLLTSKQNIFHSTV